jgi:hypothetical protein
VHFNLKSPELAICEVLLPANIFSLFFKRGFSEQCYPFPVGFLFHEEGSPLQAKIFLSSGGAESSIKRIAAL